MLEDAKSTIVMSCK